MASTKSWNGGNKISVLIFFYYYAKFCHNLISYFYNHVTDFHFCWKLIIYYQVKNSYQYSW